VDGGLSGKMLLVLLPGRIATGSGSAVLSIGLMGEGTAPTSTAPSSSTGLRPDLSLRGLRREIALTGGTIKFTDKLVELDGVSGTVDDEGTSATSAARSAWPAGVRSTSISW